jgi:hypothetical protein
MQSRRCHRIPAIRRQRLPARRSSKHIFFEKKKQETLMILPRGTARKQKFFGSFFQKRTSFLSLSFKHSPVSALSQEVV